jgi:ubiquinone biosynthesis protein
MELIDDRVDVRALKAEGKDLLERYGHQSLESLDIAQFITDVFATIQRHHVALPSDLLLMAKAVATMEGIAQELYPAYDPLSEMRAYLLKVYAKRLTDPAYLLKELYSTVDATVYFLRRLPRELDTIVTRLRKGELVLKVDEVGQERRLRTLERGATRLAMAVTFFGLSLSSTLLLLEPSGPTVFGLPATTLLGSLGYLGAGWLGGLLMLSFLRSS